MKLRCKLIESENLHCSIKTGWTSKTQDRFVVPKDHPQTLIPDVGYLFSSVTVDAIPSNYGRISYNGIALTVQ